MPLPLSLKRYYSKVIIGGTTSGAAAGMVTILPSPLGAGENTTATDLRGQEQKSLVGQANEEQGVPPLVTSFPTKVMELIGSSWDPNSSETPNFIKATFCLTKGARILVFDQGLDNLSSGWHVCQLPFKWGLG